MHQIYLLGYERIWGTISASSYHLKRWLVIITTIYMYLTNPEKVKRGANEQLFVKSIHPNFKNFLSIQKKMK